MKKIIFASAILLSTIAATAQRRTTTTTSTRTTSSSMSTQTSTGLANTVLLYGNLGFSSTKEANETKVSSFDFNPGIGYQFNDNWAAGLAVRVGLDKTDPKGDDNETKSNDFELGPFVRYTQPLSNIFNVFGQLDLGFKASKVDPPGDNNEVKSSGFYGQIAPAIQVNVKNWFALNFGFGGLRFDSDKVEDADNAKTSIKFDFGQQVNIGISKNF
ncbi:MAG: porin family protein [Chitinophagaceae bacterium]|nr:porin family protein [Chitinophagaceae bacterium]